MSNYERTESEKSSGNRNHISRAQVFNTISQSIIREESEKKARAREVLRHETQGNGKYVMNGSNDRVNGKIYDGGNITLYPTQADQRSYFYGYTYHGSRRLYAVIELLQKENRIEEIIQIGYRDFEHGIDENHLGMLKQNEYYMEGYNAAQKVQKTR